MTVVQFEMTPEMLDEVAAKFRLLSDPMRLRILYHLKGGEKTVSELVELCQASQPNVSKHLSTLKAQKIVQRRQSGNNAYFSVNSPMVYQLCETVCSGLHREFEETQQLYWGNA